MSKGIIAIVLVVVIFSALIYNFTKSDVIELPGVEIREYEGERLDSINNFRENSIKGIQHIDINDYHLEISGLVAPKSLSYNEVLEHQAYSKVVQLNCVEGWSAKILWEGVLVRDLFENLSISDEANTVIFYAVDGYSTAFPLQYFYDKDIIMAYKMNGVTIPDERGFPFQIIAEDRWGYKWIKWITRIELSDNADYEGFWESRGYSTTGNLNESFFS